jgi:hypothetical protein
MSSSVILRCVDLAFSDLLTLVLAQGFFYPEDGGDTFLRKVG